jgi:translocation and assembly module TamB
MKVVRRLAIAALILLVVAAGALYWVAQSDWLRERVRRGVIAQAEKLTGGRVELGAFRWDWRRVTVEADRFIVHGTEPAGTMPLLSVEKAEAQLRILSFLSRTVAIESIVVEHPSVHLIIQENGATNLPRPKVQRKGSAMETLLDMKVGRFDLRGGTFDVESPGQAPRRSPWSARGENLAAHVMWDGAGQRYTGTLALDPLRLLSASFSVNANASLEQDRIVVSSAEIRSGDAEVKIAEAALTHFAAPVITARYTGHVSCRSGLFVCPSGLSGVVAVDGAGRYVSLSEYQANGSFTAAGDFGKVRNAHAAGAYQAQPHLVTLQGVHGSALGGTVLAEASLRDFDSYSAKGTIAHIDLRDAAALETSRRLPYDGIVAGSFQVSGRISGRMEKRLPDAQARLTISGPEARGEVAVRYDSAKATVELGNSWVELPHTRVDVAGTLGSRLAVKASSQDVRDLLPVLSGVPDFRYGAASFEGTVTGPLQDPKVVGHATAQGFVYQGQNFDSLAGDVSVASDLASVRNGSVAYGELRAQGSGSVGLTNWTATAASSIAASVDVHNADIAKVAAMAGHKELPVTGTLSGNGVITGVLGNPLANADVTLARGTIHGQPFDSITGKLQLADRNSQSLTGLFVSGPKRVNISARFEHAGTEFPAGTLDFNLTSNTMPLNQIALVRARQPDIHGFGKFHADGTVRMFHDAKHELQYQLTNVNADASANSLELGGRNLGDARLTVQTKDGVAQTHFESNAAKAVIRGEGTVKLAGNYPVDGHITFTNVGLNAMAALIVKEDDAASLNFDGEAQGEASISGSALNPDEWTAQVDIPKLEVRPLPGSDFAKAAPQFVFTNEGPLRVALAKSQLRIESVHFKAPETDLNIEGTVALTEDAPLNLRVTGDVNLALARSFNKDLTSSGALMLNAAVRGKWNAPDVTGRAVIRNGEFRYADLTNGLTNANGEIGFNGTRATIQSFSAESGGGKVEVSGFVARSASTTSFRLEANAQQVRLRYPEGVSSVSDAALTLFGTLQRSEVSGTITVRRVSINPRSDTGTILQNAAAPLQAATSKTGITSNMNLDVKIQTAPDVALQTSVAQSLDADAALTLRGTVANPAVLGRINITQGELVFFGNKYSINQGSISFLNPARIDPILNIDFETKARGVDVVLTVAGPINKLNVSYRSDPPLQFGDIVTLLATGRAPTDPTLAGRDTGQVQSLQQLGASALLGQAIASPVAGRLQRFFGVSRLKIDPSLTGITGSPEARLTIEQQVTPEVLFTYITDVSSTSTQLIRVEWSFNRQWSAILVREENGYVGLDFAYKKRFK